MWDFGFGIPDSGLAACRGRRISQALPVIMAVLLLAPALSMAAQPTALQILEKAAKNYDCIKDYIVDVTMLVDSPVLHMPPTNIKVYYKSPDKIHVESNGSFAMLPRDGMSIGNPIRELIRPKGPAPRPKLSLAPNERISGRLCHVVIARYVSPDGQTTMTSRLWIDSVRLLVLRVVGTPPGAQSFKLDISYSKVAKRYWLPSESTAHLTFPSVPGSHPDMTAPPPKPSTVKLKFKNYRVNTGLSDKVFREKKGSG